MLLCSLQVFKLLVFSTVDFLAVLFLPLHIVVFALVIIILIITLIIIVIILTLIPALMVRCVQLTEAYFDVLELGEIVLVSIGCLLQLCSICKLQLYTLWLCKAFQNAAVL